MKLKQAIKHSGKYADSPVSNSYPIDHMSCSSGSASSQLVQVASWEISRGLSIASCSWKSDLAQAESSEKSKNNDKNGRFAVTIHDSSSDSDSLPSRYGSTGSNSSPEDAASSILAPTATTVHKSNIQKRNASVDDDTVTMNAKQIQKQSSSSLFAPLWSCLNPTVPGETGTKLPVAATSQMAAMRALHSNEDTLDMVFSSFENIACRQDTIFEDLKKHHTVQEESRHDESNFAPRENHLGGGSTRPSTRSRNLDTNKAATLMARPKRDVLDSVFEGVERLACRDDANLAILVNQEPDMLDRVFERAERGACREDYHGDAPSRQSREDTPSRIQKKKGTVVAKNGDILDYFCEGLEGAVCRGNDDVVAVGEPDILDRVFEGFEHTICRNSSRVKSGGDAIQPIDLTSYSLDAQNSIIDQPYYAGFESDLPGENLGSFESQKRVILRGGHPDAGDVTQSLQLKRKDKRDVIDYVFDGMESAVCHHEEDSLPPRPPRVETTRFERAKTTRRVYPEDPSSKNSLRIPNKMR